MWRVILIFAIFKQGLCGPFDFMGFDDPYNIFYNTRNLFYRQHQSRCVQGSGSSTRDEGICLTRPECNFSGGTAQTSPDCFLGICCVYSKGCNQHSDKRVSYFEHRGTVDDTCAYTVNVENTNICQMRIDFESFALPPPTMPMDGTTQPYRCLDMYFEIISPKVHNVPLLCGNNDGQHMYIPIDATSEKSLKMQVVNRAGTTQPGIWNIKVTQLECPGQVNSFAKHGKSSSRPRDDFDLLAPDGCLQYFYNKTGTVKNFGYDETKTNEQNHYIGNMDYAICFKRDSDSCGASFTTDQFQLSDATPCEDALIIPSGSITENGMVTPQSEFCGTSLMKDSVVDSNTPGPIYIRFKTDNKAEMDDEHGFLIKYATNRAGNCN